MKVSGKEPDIFLVLMRLRETPVPIPNTMVKPQAADNTMLGTAWEDRWVPGTMKNSRVCRLGQAVPAGFYQ